jgi:methylated-DNA-[protein]-cysteine S-methyltransferase
MPTQTIYYPSPLGVLEIKGDEQAITSVLFCDDSFRLSDGVPACLLPCVQQLEEYFRGERREFNLPMTQHGTKFQQKVWEALLSVPFGRTVSYLHIARMLHNAESVRAVGMANGRNQLGILVPCHRIIGHDGKLTGYAGGLWRKQWLLEHERVHSGQGQLSMF